MPAFVRTPACDLHAAARFEFRTFGDGLGDFPGRLGGTFAKLAEEERTDVYLLGEDPARSFKLRGRQRLELKLLLGEAEGGCQVWRPAGRCALPATGRLLRARFRAVTGRPDFAPAEVYDPQRVVATFEKHGERPLAVFKRRILFGAGEATVEWARITPDGQGDSVTLALEGEDPQALRQLWHDLGMARRRNVSYPEFLVGT